MSEDNRGLCWETLVGTLRCRSRQVINTLRKALQWHYSPTHLAQHPRANECCRNRPVLGGVGQSTMHDDTCVHATWTVPSNTCMACLSVTLSFVTQSMRVHLSLGWLSLHVCAALLTPTFLIVRLASLSHLPQSPCCRCWEPSCWLCSGPAAWSAPSAAAQRRQGRRQHLCAHANRQSTDGA